MKGPSKRLVFAMLIAVTIPLGLLSRTRSVPMPALVREFGGDVLSATCIYFGVVFCLQAWPPLRCATVAFATCVVIEMQQLLRWRWLVRLRDDTPLDILLGHGFLWRDIASYAIGVAFGVMVGRGALMAARAPSRIA